MDGINEIFANSTNGDIFIGNTGNTDERKINKFDEPFFARTVKLHPLTWYRHISLRWEIMGCYTEG